MRNLFKPTLLAILLTIIDQTIGKHKNIYSNPIPKIYKPSIHIY